MITYEQWVEKVVKGKKRFIYTEDGPDDVVALRTSESRYTTNSYGECEIENDEELMVDAVSAEDCYLTEEELAKELNGPKKKKENKK